MIRAHKIRLNPTTEQEVYFRKAAGTKRFVYNQALDLWKWGKQVGAAEFGVMEIKRQFNLFKEEQFPWMYEVAKDVFEGAIADLGVALKNYFEAKDGKRKGAKVGFPKYKSKKNKQQSFRLNNDKFKVEGHNFWVPNLGWVNMAEKVRFVGKIMGAVVSKVADWWFVSIQVEIDVRTQASTRAQPRGVPAQTSAPLDYARGPCRLLSLPKQVESSNEQPVSAGSTTAPKQFEKQSTGVDVGIKTLAFLSDGDQFENQKPLKSGLKRLRQLSRGLSRKVKGSNRWWKAKRKLARFHFRIVNKRADDLHQASYKIASTYAFIGVEDLHVKGMVKNRRLSLALSDVGLGELIRQIEYKSKAFGGRVVRVGRFYASSKTCSDCGHVNRELELKDRTWTCQGCGAIHDRDWNAAKNIEQEALRIAFA